MHIEVFNNNGTKYLRLAQSRWGVNSKGVKTTVKQIVLNIGPLSRFDDGEPDYLARLKESFKTGEPLIDSLVPFVNKSKQEDIVSIIKYRSGDPECLGETKLMAPYLLDPVFSSLGLDQFFSSVKFSSRIDYDLLGIVRLLVYGRLLNPASKSATMRQNTQYLDPLVKSDNKDNVYDALTVVNANAKKIFRRINTNIANGIGRNPSAVFYDVTNFFFETEQADEDELDVEGNVVSKGLRKFGVSKENRKQPIVQLGLFMDDNGIPISFGMFPGNTLDHHTFRPAMEETLDTFDMGRFILVADRGMYSATNMLHVTDSGNGYIVSKSLRKSTAAQRKWAISSEGYTVVSEKFRFKSVIKELAVVSETGEKRRVKQKIVVYWSKSFYDRDFFEHQKFLDFVERLKANPTGFRVTAAQSKSLKRFMKKDVVNTKNGEMLDGSSLVAVIDDDKLNEFTELMGYYQIVTSELEMDDRAIIEKYHGLTQIEDQFREMKSTFETRPVFVRTKEHIHAHLMICFIALTMMRLIQRKIAIAEPLRDNGDIVWSYGMPGERVAEALGKWQVIRHPGELYQLLNTADGDIGRILTALGITIKPKIYTKGELTMLRTMVKPL